MKTIVSNLVVFAAFAAAPAVQAQGYFGASAGVTNANLDCAGTTSCDNTASGGKIFGGYRLSNGIGIEGIYYSLGSAKAGVVVNGLVVDGSIKSSGAGAGVSYTANFGTAWTATARLGIASNRAAVSVRSGSLSASDGDRSTQPYVGASIGYRVTPNLSVDLSLDSSRFEYAGDGYNVRAIGAGVTFSF